MGILDDHPAPWRLDEDDRVVDARGAVIMSGGCVGYENASLCVSKDVLQLVLAAPDLFALLKVLTVDPVGSVENVVRGATVVVERIEGVLKRSE